MTTGKSEVSSKRLSYADAAQKASCLTNKPIFQNGQHQTQDQKLQRLNSGEQQNGRAILTAQKGLPYLRAQRQSVASSSPPDESSESIPGSPSPWRASWSLTPQSVNSEWRSQSPQAPSNKSWRPDNRRLSSVNHPANVPSPSASPSPPAPSKKSWRPDNRRLSSVNHPANVPSPSASPSPPSSFRRPEGNRRGSQSSRQMSSRGPKEGYTLQGYKADIGVFPPGTIIRAPVAEQHAETLSKDPLSGWNLGQFGNFCIKWRRMVVVTSFPSHYICVPIFTFNGKGIPRGGNAYKNPKDFMFIYDHRGATVRPEQDKEIMGELTSKYFKDDVDKLADMATVSVTYPITRRSDCVSIVEGRLRMQSTKLLIEGYVKRLTENVGMWLGDIVVDEDETRKFRGQQVGKFRPQDYVADLIAAGEPDKYYDLKSETMVFANTDWLGDPNEAMKNRRGEHKTRRGL